jgi:hypothetical protein
MTARCIKLAATATLAGSWAVLAGGCVTVGYDFLKQQATLTYTQPKTDGYKK